MHTRGSWKLAVVVSLAVAGCAGKTPPSATVIPDCDGPAWTCIKSGPCPLAEYKESLCAVGIADSISSYSLGMEAAATRARREMGAVLKSEVEGFTRAVQDSLSKQGVGEDSVQKVGDLSQTAVEVSLNGVSVPRTWYNKETKVYFAMAVVDSKTFVNALKGLRDAKGLSEQVKQEINNRADAIVSEWQSERERRAAK